MRKLIFFAATDPATEPKPIWSAYHFAAAAARAGLEAEVRLAGDAVRVVDEDVFGADDTGSDLRAKVAAGVGAPFAVSLCPNSSRSRGVTPEQMERIGAATRPLADILTETADDRSTLIYIG